MECEWFQHPEWWFAGDTYDETITSKFASLLDIPSDTLKTTASPIEYIIIYDQLPRHVFRKGPNAHVITFFLQKALEASRNFQDLDSLDDARFCFALLPRRHAGHARDIQCVLQLTWQRITSCDPRQDLSILKRFLKATYARCPVIPPEIATQPKEYDRTILAFDPSQDPIPPLASHRKYLCIDTPTTKALRHCIVSLSGGVDSMLCSWLLHHAYHNNKNVVLTAVHINYANRPTSDAEAAFVASWCAGLDIPCYIRRISEIQRAPCMQHNMRETYETYTRHVRFAAYKHVIAMYPDLPAAVVLGHNKDDVLENIFTNLAGRSKYENLDGMEVISNASGVDFWRPLLHVSKDDIIRACQDLNVPYLPNSTPPWSMRGQIRNKVVPCVSTWNPAFCGSLHALSDTLKDLHGALDDLVNTVLCSKTSLLTDDVVSLSLTTLPRSKVFWGVLFKKLGFATISHKSLDNFVTKLLSGSTTTKTVLSKQLTVIVKHAELKSKNDQCKVSIGSHQIQLVSSSSSAFLEGVEHSGNHKDGHPNDRDN